MINFTGLLCGKLSEGDGLRYHRTTDKPVVVWNSTRKCNLSCRHCYTSSTGEKSQEELSTPEAMGFIRGLAQFGVPVLLFSGGEPLMRDDIFTLGAEAKRRGMRAVISTNGTLITKDVAQKIRAAGFDYVGVSLDGTGSLNDGFRGKKGAFKSALSGIRNLKDAGQKTGLRFTITKYNAHAIKDVFELAERENIMRVCFYHLVYSGRGSFMVNDDITHQETRAVVDDIRRWTISLHDRGMDKEVLTVDNHADGVYLYLEALQKDPHRAKAILQLLKANGGNGSGKYIACVDERGEVHADQFMRSHSFGNIHDRDFSSIWSDGTNELLGRLRNREKHLTGRCSRCRHMPVCNGNFRARALAVHNDIWHEDPACYLNDKEIS
ncbi:MAG: radical SAM protein [Endomicrobiales bacterium]|jgi:radical SAM protein with 4Fe4S-binding SPASM domain